MHRRFATAALTLALILGHRAAPAQSGPGGVVDFTLPTTEGRTRSVSQYRGRVVIIFYETRDSTNENQQVKDALGQRLRADPSLVQRFMLIPVANVGDYNFWPAHTFAREAISAVANSQHVVLWFDWNHALTQRLGMRDGTSNIVVLDRDGRVRFRRLGPMRATEIPGFLQQVQELANET